MPFLIALAAAAALTPLAAAAGTRLGLVDRPGALKIHDASIPVTGGVSVVVAALLAAALAELHLPWVAAAVVVALAGGLLDDLRPSPPWVRLVVQAAAGGLLVAGGLRLEPFGALGGAMLVVATVACCNAVNMVDGQDGLAAGLGAIAALGLAGVLVTIHVGAALPLALAGALLGFLAWNRPPARVYLGDGGAYAAGVLLAATAAQATTEGWHGLLAAGACLGVFAYELVSTIVRRATSAGSALAGDREHAYDRLARRLGSRTRSTLVLWGVGALCAAAGIAVVRLEPLVALGLILAITFATSLIDIRLLPVSVAKGER